MKALRLILAFFLVNLLWLPFVHAKDSALIIFDGSGSMWGQIEGKHKIEIAREVMGTLVKDWNEDIDLGLMAYGHREKGNCADIEVLFPVGTPDSKKILNIINKLSPKGKTPISQSLKQAAETLRYTEDPATVILISDGEETCNSDPCVVSKELEAKGINFTAHVIGFDVKGNEKALEQLQCIAENTGGQFYEAEDAEELTKAIVQVQKEVEDPRPTLCKQYAEQAIEQEQQNITMECGYTGQDWSTDYDIHSEWCMSNPINSEVPKNKLQSRADNLTECKAAKEKTKSGKGTFEFNWVESGCWSIEQNQQLIKNGCGADKVELNVGAYSVTPRIFPLFDPFEINIEDGKLHSVTKGGLLVFRGAGGNCWNTFRDTVRVGSGCGAGTEGLQAGDYIIKPSVDNSFPPVTVKVDKGKTTIIEQ